MVKDTRSRMSFFVVGLGRASTKEGRVAMVIGNMHISRLMVYVQQVEEVKLRDIEEYMNKKSKTEIEVSIMARILRTSLLGQPNPMVVWNKEEFLDPTCAKCCRKHPDKCHNGKEGCFKFGQEGHFLREFPKNKQGGVNPENRDQSSSVAPPDRAATREATSGIGGGENCLYAITSHQEKEHSQDVITGMIKVFTFDVYAVLEP
ncbi:uncharacterized protein LOC107027686 [Solanum pennellii]|uniref:Uncharacterized protein LOC107027686 n=1 Tax=Solanum pennellii TaxID=28526 RepID=A0ABM1HE92_SOLPN|nr:uncharacterized protein LOC107027686 [Solanum pennellii]